MFSSVGTSKPELVVPRHVQSYYKYNRDNPVILVYEHLGSTSDRAKYPRCELIVYQEDQKVFGQDEQISIGLQELFNKVRDTRILTKPVATFNLPNQLLTSSKIKSQYIDNKGKCRGIVLQLESDQKLTVYTTPLQPLPVSEVTLTNEDQVHVDVAKRFGSEFGLVVHSQRIVRNRMTELNFSYGSTILSVSVKPTRPLEKVPTISHSYICASKPSEQSEMITYTTQSLETRILTSYTRWLFSHYLKEHTDDSQLLTDDLLYTTFAEKGFYHPTFNPIRESYQ